MTRIEEYRAWVQSLTQLRVAMRAMDGVPFLGIGPELRAECKEIWDRMDDLRARLIAVIDEMDAGLTRDEVWRKERRE